MTIHKIIQPACGTNCYVLVNENTKEALVIDPGSAGERTISEIDKLGVKPVAILLTHGHFDHAGEAALLSSNYNIKVYASRLEKETLESPEINLSFSMYGESEIYHADIFLDDEQEFELAGFKIRCLSTPGHTPGGCCYFFPYENCVFTGDTLFEGSVGRTDFPGGSMSTLVNSVRTKLMTLKDDTVCYPGHEGSTTIENERIYNPYL